MSRRMSGIAGIAFGLLTLLAFILASPPGGTYEQSSVTGFLAKGHHAAIAVSIYVAVLATVALVLLLVRIRETAGSDAASHVVWGVGLTAAATYAAGFAVQVSVPMAMWVGGSQVTIDPKLAFFFAEVGGAILLGGTGILLGLALLVLALSRPALPAPLRWFTLACGIVALASPLFFPVFVLLVWGVVTGIWLLRSEPLPEAAAAAGTY